MADAKLTAYKTTATSISWTSGQSLASLADNEYTDLSDEIDNSSNNYILADIYLDLGSAAFTGADSQIEIYLVPSVDGTNYPTWTGNVTTDEQENSIHFVGAVTTTGSTAVQDLVLRAIPLPAGKYKYAFRNRSGVALNATNTAYWRPFQYQSV